MKYRVKMPNKARTKYQKCLICQLSKLSSEFRGTAGKPKRSPFCRECRKNKQKAVKEFYGGSFRHKKKPVFDYQLWRFNFVRLTEHFSKKLQPKEVKKMAEEKAKKYLKLPERIAAIIGKTYTVAGDDFGLADDEALTRIRDLLDELDETLIERNKKKRLSK